MQERFDIFLAYRRYHGNHERTNVEVWYLESKDISYRISYTETVLFNNADNCEVYRFSDRQINMEH
jgi:hypothetical protein